MLYTICAMRFCVYEWQYALATAFLRSIPDHKLRSGTSTICQSFLPFATRNLGRSHLTEKLAHL
jgi:hypothetical protein